MIARRPFLGTSALAVLASLAAPAQAARPRDWKALAAEVRAEMAWAWANYRALAWGKDQIRPISGGHESFPLKDRHLGLSLVEALDTLWLMGLDREFADGVAWVKATLDFDVDGEVSVFETNIRLVGGLLSAHHACGDPVLLAKARDLADRLLPAFATPTGMPYRYVDLRTGAVRDAATNPAEVGTHIAEFGTLSKLTGDPRYFDTAKRAMLAMVERMPGELLADRIDATTGRWLSRRATVGPPSDSFYEYAWDGWQLFGDRDCKRIYDRLTAGILAHQQRRDARGALWFVDVDFLTGERLSDRQDELASFYGGLLAQGRAGATGAAYTRSWAGVQDRFGVLPEEYDTRTRTATAKGNALRPELADAALNLWLVDRRDEWRELGARHFLAMKRWNRARYGYADLADVTATPKLQADHCPGYWWSEQMKYYWLLFSDTPRFDYADNYLSTEGNVFRGLIRPG